MKIIVHLILLALVSLAIAWFGFGIHPMSLWQRALNVVGDSDMADTAEKFRNVAGNRMDEARDVYNGKTEVDDPFAHPLAK